MCPNTCPGAWGARGGETHQTRPCILIPSQTKSRHGIKCLECTAPVQEASRTRDGHAHARAHSAGRPCWCSPPSSVPFLPSHKCSLQFIVVTHTVWANVMCSRDTSHPVRAQHDAMDDISRDPRPPPSPSLPPMMMPTAVWIIDARAAPGVQEQPQQGRQQHPSPSD